MVAAVAEISHLRTACSYQASPFVTMVALRPIFRPIGAAAPAFGPMRYLKFTLSFSRSNSPRFGRTKPGDMARALLTPPIPFITPLFSTGRG